MDLFVKLICFFWYWLLGSRGVVPRGALSICVWSWVVQRYSHCSGSFSLVVCLFTNLGSLSVSKQGLGGVSDWVWFEFNACVYGWFTEVLRSSIWLVYFWGVDLSSSRGRFSSVVVVVVTRFNDAIQWRDRIKHEVGLVCALSLAAGAEIGADGYPINTSISTW